MNNRLLGIEKDLYEVVMDLWKADKTDAEIAEHINLNYRHPRNQRLISRRTINRVIWRARAAKDPRAIYHGNRNLSPTPREHVAYRKPSSSLFRRKVVIGPDVAVETRAETQKRLETDNEFLP